MTEHSSPMSEQLFQSCLSELTEGHLALDRLGAPREVQEGDVIRECLIAERISSVAQAPLWEGSPQWQFVQRLQAYLDDAPADGRHSDAAGGNAYDLIEEAIGWMTQ